MSSKRSNAIDLSDFSNFSNNIFLSSVFFRLEIVNSIISFSMILFRFIWTCKFRVRSDFVVHTIISSPPDGWQLYNILYFHLIFGATYSTFALNMLSNFHTSTTKSFQLMAQIDMHLLVTSPLRRIVILTNPSLHDETIECQIIFKFYLLNISSQLLTLSLIITILILGIDRIHFFWIRTNPDLAGSWIIRSGPNRILLDPDPL